MNAATEDEPMDEPVDDNLLRICRECGRTFMSADPRDFECEECEEYLDRQEPENTIDAFKRERDT